MATDRHFAVRRRNKAGDHPHGGGFSGAVRPKKPKHLAAFDGKGHIVNGNFGTESFDDVFDFDHRGGEIEI